MWDYFFKRIISSSPRKFIHHRICAWFLGHWVKPSVRDSGNSVFSLRSPVPQCTGLSEENTLLSGGTCLVAFCVKGPVFAARSLRDRADTQIGTFIYNLGRRPAVTSAGSVSSTFIPRGGWSVTGGAEKVCTIIAHNVSFQNFEKYFFSRTTHDFRFSCGLTY